jgi:hypothetical protein
MSQRKKSPPPLNDDEVELIPLDEDEQKQLIESIKSQARQQAQSIRRMFSILYAVITMIFIFCFVRLFYYPDSYLSFEERLIEKVLSRASFIVFYMLSILITGICSVAFTQVYLFPSIPPYSEYFIGFLFCRI